MPSRNSSEPVDPRYIVPGLSRGLALMQLFPRSKPAKTLAELAAGLGLSRSATYRLVYTLEADGFIARDAETRRYRLTSKTLDLGFEYLHAQSITESAQSFLRTLSDRSKAAAHVAILDGWHAVYLARALPNAGLVSNLQLGARLPAHATSSGRIMLAHQDEPHLRTIYDRLRKELRSARTVPSLPEFNAQIVADRKRGYVFHKSTVDPGLVSLAYPIRDHRSQVVAAVTVIVPEKLSARSAARKRCGRWCMKPPTRYRGKSDIAADIEGMSRASRNGNRSLWAAIARGKRPLRTLLTEKGPAMPRLFSLFSSLTLLAITIQGPVFAQINDAVPRFEPAPCPKLEGAEALGKATCGYLVVHENRSKPTARSIRLLVAKYPSRSPEKQPDPVVYVAGGPGDIAPLEVNGLIAADFIRDRDILVVSQRGTMFSEPALTCASIDDFARSSLRLRFYSDETRRAHLAATEACHRTLTETGADLSAYNSTESAADFADLRRVLGYGAWNIYGTSYGSYLAQTIMRDHPEGIRSVVLDSVLPTNYSVPANWWNTRAGFDNLFRACVAEAACNAAHPRFQETFTRLVNKLEAAPLTTMVRDPATGKDIAVMLDGGALVDWLRNQNYAVASLRAAPNLIDGLAADRPDSIAAIATDRASRAPPSGPNVPSLGYGLAFGVSCREDYPFATPDELAVAGREAFPDYPASVQREGVGGWAYFNEDCRDIWKVPAAPQAMREPVASSVPTLLISGSFDTLTSLAGAKAAAAKLSNATIISIPGIGHFVSPNSPCAQRVIVSILANPSAPDTSCVGGLTPQTFAAPTSP